MEFEKSERPVSFNNTDWCDFWTKSVEVLSKNLFCTHQPLGGAITGPCQKLGRGSALAPKECECSDSAWQRQWVCKYLPPGGAITADVQIIIFIFTYYRGDGSAAGPF